MATSDSMSLKELHKLIRTVDKLTTGQAKIDIDDQELECETDTAFILLITPNDGCYKGATCKFKVVIPSTYPESPPSVTCLNRIYHPNIDIPEDECGAPICVNLLDSDWEPHVGLDGCVMAVLFLFYNPNPDDALSPVFEAGIDDEEFEKNVRASLRGEMVEDMVFDKLLDDEEGDDNCQLEDKSADHNNGDNGEVTPTETVKDDDVNADANTKDNNNSQNVKETLTENEDEKSETSGQSHDTSEKNNNENIGGDTTDGVGTNEIIIDNCTHSTNENQELGDNEQTLVLMLKEADGEHREKARDCVCNAELQSGVFEHENSHQLTNVTDRDAIIDDRAKKLQRTLNEQRTNLNNEGTSDQTQSHDVVSTSNSRLSKVESENYSNECGAEGTSDQSRDVVSTSTSRLCVAEGTSDQSRDLLSTSTSRLSKVDNENYSTGCVALQTLNAIFLAENTKGHGPIIWHKTLSIFGRVYRWLKGCTRRQSCEIYVVSRADLKQR